jgi:uncharacterized protein YbaP (TraB family)
MNGYRCIISLSFVFSFFYAEGQLLWSIHHPSWPAEDSSYLYGTIHQGDTSVIAWDDTFYDCLLSCDFLVGELDFSNRDSIEAVVSLVQSVMFAPQDLVYTPSQQDSLQVIQRRLDQDFDAETAKLVMRMKPVYAGVALGNLYSIKRANEKEWTVNDSTEVDKPDEEGVEKYNYSPDIILQDIARNESMQIVGLERAEEQLTVLDGIPLSMQIRWLWLTVFDTLSVEQEPSKTPSLDMLVQAYQAQDLKSLHAFLAEQDQLPQFIMDAIYLNRNNTMVQRLLPRLQRGESMFIAVGAGHLVGEEGIINQLKRLGYEVKPVWFHWTK